MKMIPFSRIKRLDFLAVVAAWLCVALHALAQSAQPDSEWVVTPGARLLDRANVLPNSPALVKSLGDAAEYVLRWQVPASGEAWGKRRPEVERAFRKAIGLEKLPERTPLNARVLARHDLGEYTIENVVFESRPGFPVSANLYRSNSPSKGKRAAILCPIGHFGRLATTPSTSKLSTRLSKGSKRPATRTL